MKTGDKLASFYDLDVIAQEAVRQQDANDAIKRLDRMIRDSISPSRGVQLGPSVRNIHEWFGEIGLSTNAYVPPHKFETRYSRGPRISRPYDRFQHLGVELCSKAVRLSFDTPKDGSDIKEAELYLLGITWPANYIVDVDLYRQGALKPEDSDAVFFTIEDDAAGIHLKVADGEERYSIVEEFKKAATELG
jgi:hypothetical protein